MRNTHNKNALSLTIRTVRRELLDDTSTSVCLKQILKICNIRFKFSSAVRISDELPLRRSLNDHTVGVNVTLILDRRLGRLKRLMRRKNQSVRIVNQCISGDSGLLLVSARETTINNENLSSTLDRALSILRLDRNMTVDDVTVLW